MSASNHHKTPILKYILPIVCSILLLSIAGLILYGVLSGGEPSSALPPPSETPQSGTVIPSGAAQPSLTEFPSPSAAPQPDQPKNTAPSGAAPNTQRPTVTPPAPSGQQAAPPSAAAPSCTAVPPVTAVPSKLPGSTPALSRIPDPTAAPSSAPRPTAAPSPSATPKPTAAPNLTSAPKPTSAPVSQPETGKSAAGSDTSIADVGVSANGQLQVIGTQLSNQSGSPVVLRGISTAGIAWFPDFATKAFMKTLRDEWGASVFRIAMYSYEGSDSYVNNPSWNKTKVCSLIDAAIELDMYVIVDWHILADGNPQTYQTQAAEFFTYIASAYPEVPNILYEICNEPNGGVSWSGNIKPYAEEIIPLIRSYSPDAVIIVGTPTWSQDVDAAAEAPLAYDNIMYSLHFYAGTHKEWLRSKADTALRKGLPLFVTEWGTTDASGNGNVDTASSDEWLEYLEANSISWCNWSLCNKAEASALLLPSAGTSGAMPDSVLSVSGKYVKKKLLEYSKNSANAKENSVSDPTPDITRTPTAAPAPDTDSSTPATPDSPPITAPPDGDSSGLMLLAYNENREIRTNTISPRIQIKNNTGNDISLDQLTIVYYYIPESNAAQNFWCDYAEVSGSTYRAITGSITGNYRNGKETCCMEITFDSAAGILAPGDTAALQLRITNEDWSGYDQSNDMSFLPSASTWQENPPLDLLLCE